MHDTFTYRESRVGAGGVAVLWAPDTGTARFTIAQGGTALITAAAGTVTPGTLAQEQVFTYTPPAWLAAGTYDVSLVWNEGGVAIAPATFTAAYGGGLGPVYKWVRHKLQKSEAELPDNHPGMVRDTESVVRGLLSSYPCLGSYAAITGADKTRFDEAAGLIVAAKLRPVLMSGANEGRGQVTSEKAGDVELRYGGGSTAGKTVQPMEQQWEAEALTLLHQITCIKQDNIKRAAESPRAVYATGARKQAEANGYGCGFGIIRRR